ncbi:MAG: MFS transporter [Hyphomicrobiales bacterium]|nr:MFS transporter [Hyphomicrobiales bacterium]
MIRPRLTLALATSQLVAWGVGYYAIGVFGPRIVAEEGWSRAEIHAGFSLALVAMGLVSPAIGARVDRVGGRAVMTGGFLLLALGLGLAALARRPVEWWVIWPLIGVALRMTLYDACFAALVRVDPAAAARAIAAVTLAGGLASTVFWALGDRLAEAFGWRVAMAVFAAIAAVAAVLPLALPAAPSRHAPPPATDGAPTPLPPIGHPRDIRLFAALIVATSVLASALAAHMIPLLVGLGLTLPVAVAAARGVGQSVARAVDVLYGRRLPPLDLALLAAALLPATLAAAPFAGVSTLAALAFSFGGGAGNGLMTIARGVAPLVLFDPKRYGAITGRIAAPAFWTSAAAPFVVALALDRGGAGLALAVLAVPAVAAFTAAFALRTSKRARS